MIKFFIFLFVSKEFSYKKAPVIKACLTPNSVRCGSNEISTFYFSSLAKLNFLMLILKY